MNSINSFIDKTLPIEPDEKVFFNLLDIVKFIDEDKINFQLLDLIKYINDITNNVFAFYHKEFYFVSSYLNSNRDRIVHPSIINIDYFLCIALDYNNKLNVDDDDTYSKRIEDLKKIKSEDELKEKFPYVFFRYEYFKTTFNIIKQWKKSTINWEKKYLRVFRDNDSAHTSSLIEYFKNNKEFNLSSFIRNYITGLEVLIDNYETLELSFIQKELDIDLNIKNEKDKDKIELVIAYAYMDCLKNTEDINQKQIYLYYLANYFEENALKIDSIKYYNSNKDKIMYLKDLYDEYIKVLKENPNLRIIDFKKEDFSDMTVEESKEFMDEYLKDLHATWKFFDGSSLDIDDDFIEDIKDKINSITDPEKRKKALENLKLFIEKKKYYDSSDPFYRIQGINSFDGYIGYIYPNGIVVLDKFFDNTKTNRLAKNQAIYVMNIMDLYSISINPKNSIITNSLCERFIHKGDWKSKVDEERKKETRIYTAKELEEMIVKGIVKR